MDWQIQVKVNEQLYLRDPEQSEIGRKIISTGVIMIDELGLEEFTFRKLAIKLETNESSVYRYFESKHRLLLYLIQWYWRWMEYQLVFRTQNINDPLVKIDTILGILFLKNGGNQSAESIDKKALFRVVVKEGSKAYLTQHVTEDNQKQFFKPYKDFCGRIAEIILEYNPGYKYARSLGSTIIEMSHYQYFFMNNLPSLTDFGEEKNEDSIIDFLKQLVLNSKGTSDS